MSNLEVITKENVDRLEDIGLDLAETYKVAFAGPPWNEVSKCLDEDCDLLFSAAQPGCECPNCMTILAEAYDSAELVGDWKRMIADEDAFMEVAFEASLPQRATIARPTDAAELFVRKYADVPSMSRWLEERLDDSFVWIEDTFANRTRKPTGNLDNRGDTLNKIARYYGGLQLVTRTLSPAVIAATLRDSMPTTTTYIGDERVGSEIVSKRYGNPSYTLPTVPDRRTLLVINQSLWKNS